MKKLLTIAGIAATLACCAPGAKASIGITTNYTPLNITITVTTNRYMATTKGYMYKLGSVSMGNSKVLTLLESSDFYNGTFPAGAKLVQGWDSEYNIANGHDGDVLVVDKTGTNVLYDASTNYYAGGNCIYIDWFEEDGPYSETYDDDVSPYFYTYTYDFNTVYFELYDDGSQYIDIYTYGNGVETYTQNYTESDDYKSWSLSAHANTSYADEDFGDDDEAAATVHLSTSGQGKDYNYYWY